MQPIDLVIALAYLVGTLAVGLYMANRNKSAEDMFAAGRQSPWWVAGLSSFMTLKSAGTFVVWGGLAYREGIVAIVITSALGLSGLLTGWLVAGRWREIGVSTPAEFVELRFGRPAVQLYTWVMMLARIVSSGVALYAVSVMLVALMPLDPGNPLRDPITGNISLTFVVAVLGILVTTYTMVGGLWAVLITDVLQFIILKLAILFVIPLIAWKLWTAPALLATPDHFFSPFTPGHGLWFVIGWVAIHFFIIGAEWAFAQRYICVPTIKDARKGAYLFGALYLISPTLWLAPAVMYRLLDDGAAPEQAYILASQSVLPVGMLGMMVAALFSATASMVSGQINVFAGVLTEQFYARWRPEASSRQLVTAGRSFSLGIGLVMTLLGVLVPIMGGAEKVIVTLTSLLFGPLMAPTIWGLLSGKVGLRSVFATVGICGATALIARFGPAGPLAGTGFGTWIMANAQLVDVLIGAVLPVMILTIAHLLSGHDKPGWQETQARAAAYAPEPIDADGPSHSPPGIIALALSVTGAIMLALLLVNDEGQATLAAFGGVTLLLAWLTWSLGRRAMPSA